MKKIWPVSNGSGNKGSFLKNAGGKESWPLDLSPTVRSPVKPFPRRRRRPHRSRRAAASPSSPPPPPRPPQGLRLGAAAAFPQLVNPPPPLRLSARHPCPLFLAAMLAESGVGQRSASLLGGGDCKRSAGDEVVRRSCSPYSSCCLCLWVEVVVNRNGDFNSKCLCLQVKGFSLLIIIYSYKTMQCSFLDESTSS